MEPITPKIRAFIAACESAGLGAVSVNISVQELKQLLAENQPAECVSTMENGECDPRINCPVHGPSVVRTVTIAHMELREFNSMCLFLMGERDHPDHPGVQFGDNLPGQKGTRYWWRTPLRKLMLRMNGEG